MEQSAVIFYLRWHFFKRADADEARMRAVPWPTTSAAAAGIVEICFHKPRETLAWCHIIKEQLLASRWPTSKRWVFRLFFHVLIVRWTCSADQTFFSWVNSSFLCRCAAVACLCEPLTVSVMAQCHLLYYSFSAPPLTVQVSDRRGDPHLADKALLFSNSLWMKCVSTVVFCVLSCAVRLASRMEAMQCRLIGVCVWVPVYVCVRAHWPWLDLHGYASDIYHCTSHFVYTSL